MLITTGTSMVDKTSVGTSTVVVIVGFDPISGAGVPNGNVLFQVLLGQEQFLHA
jgi:hypothetical protein